MSADQDDGTGQAGEYRSILHRRLIEGLDAMQIRPEKRVSSIVGILKNNGVEISTPAVNNWVLGKSKPQADLIPFLASLLGVSCDHLLGVEAHPMRVGAKNETDDLRLRIIRMIQSEALGVDALEAIAALTNHLIRAGFRPTSIS